MNCIDSIEGTAKFIINRHFRIFLEDRLDDTEYIRNIKAVIDATIDFLMENKEIACRSELLQGVLYDYAKEIWLDHVNRIRQESTNPDITNTNADGDGYPDYYFDYIYAHGAYPR